jgi:hypothetical protein
MHLILRDFLDCLTLEDGRLRLKCDSTLAETRFRLSAKRTSPFKFARQSVQSTTGSRGLRISGSIAGYTMFRGSVKATGYPLHSPVSPSLPLPASPCAITFQLDSTTGLSWNVGNQPRRGSHLCLLYFLYIWRWFTNCPALCDRMQTMKVLRTVSLMSVVQTQDLWNK